MKTYFKMLEETEKIEEILSKNGVLDILYKYRIIKESVESWDCKELNTISNCFSNCEGEKFYSNIEECFKILNDIKVMIIQKRDEGKFDTLEERDELISTLLIIQEITKYSTTINDKKAKNEVDLEMGLIIAEILELLYHLQYSIKTIDPYILNSTLDKLNDVIQHFYKSIGINIDSDLVYKIKDNENEQQVDIKDVVMSLITNIDHG